MTILATLQLHLNDFNEYVRLRGPFHSSNPQNPNGARSFSPLLSTIAT